MNDKVITIIGSLVILSLAVMFGCMDKPTEMGIIVVAGAITLAFLHIDKIQKFKGAGFEAEMKRAVEEANATIEQLREVAATSSEVILTDLMAGSFLGGISLTKRLDLHDQVIENLSDIGATQAQIETAESMWKKGIGITFHRGIRAAIESNEGTVLQEFQDLLNFDEWYVPSSSDLRVFINEKDIMNDKIDELLQDYQVYEETNTFRRRDIFVQL